MSVVERERVEEVTREATEADVLERAADLLEEFGWCQGYMGSKRDGQFCSLGALIEATNDLGGDFGAVRRALGYEDAGSMGRHIARWNDDAGRTKAEVVAKLREAAARAREEA